MVSLRENWSSRNPVDIKAPETKGAKRKVGIVVPLILVAVVVAVGAWPRGEWSKLNALVSTATPVKPNAKSAVPDKKLTHGGLDVHIPVSHPGTPLPSWVEEGLAKTVKAMQSSEQKAKNVEAKNTQLQAQVLLDTKKTSQLRMAVFSDQKRIDGLLAKLRLANTVQPIRHPHIDSVVPVQSVTSGGGIVALKSAGETRPGSGHLPIKPIAAASGGLPTKDAHGWMVIAVHAGQAVVQAPTGQVALVKQGDRIDGHIVKQINAVRRSVLLSGGLLAEMTKHG